jgi:hypothetical protein
VEAMRLQGLSPLPLALTREPRASVLLHTKLEMRGGGRLGMGSVALVNEVGQYIGSHRFWV